MGRKPTIDVEHHDVRSAVCLCLLALGSVVAIMDHVHPLEVQEIVCRSV